MNKAKAYRQAKTFMGETGSQKAKSLVDPLTGHADVKYRKHKVEKADSTDCSFSGVEKND